MYKGIYYLEKDDFISTQVIVSSRLDSKNHMWLNALTKKLDRPRAERLLSTTNALENISDKKYADFLWETVTKANEKLITEMRKEPTMCKALAELFKDEIDAAKEEAKKCGFNDGFNNGCIQTFQNMIKNGLSLELARKYANISDDLIKTALAELNLNETHP